MPAEEVLSMINTGRINTELLSHIQILYPYTIYSVIVTILFLLAFGAKNLKCISYTYQMPIPIKNYSKLKIRPCE